MVPDEKLGINAKILGFPTSVQPFASLVGVFDKGTSFIKGASDCYFSVLWSTSCRVDSQAVIVHFASGAALAAWLPAFTAGGQTLCTLLSCLPAVSRRQV